MVGVVIVVYLFQDVSPPSVTIMAGIPLVYTIRIRKYWELISLLPEMFENRMKILLGKEWESFLQAMEQPPFRGLRWNPLKCSFDTNQKRLCTSRHLQIHTPSAIHILSWINNTPPPALVKCFLRFFRFLYFVFGVCNKKTELPARLLFVRLSAV